VPDQTALREGGLTNPRTLSLDTGIVRRSGGGDATAPHTPSLVSTFGKCDASLVPDQTALREGGLTNPRTLSLDTGIVISSGGAGATAPHTPSLGSEFGKCDAGSASAQTALREGGLTSPRTLSLDTGTVMGGGAVSKRSARLARSQMMRDFHPVGDSALSVNETQETLDALCSEWTTNLLMTLFTSRRSPGHHQPLNLRIPRFSRQLHGNGPCI
jgi:hypothetical protein